MALVDDLKAVNPGLKSSVGRIAFSNRFGEALADALDPGALKNRLVSTIPVTKSSVASMSIPTNLADDIVAALESE